MKGYREWVLYLGVLGVITVSTPTCAKDLGTLGKTYKIKEQNFLEYIQQKLQGMKKSGKLALLNKKMKQRALKSIYQPKPIRRLVTATVDKTFYYDPTITVSAAIHDSQGNLIQPKGRRINPLDSVSMNSIFVFVKGEDATQLTWALDLKKEAKLLVKIILVSGPVIKLMEKHKTRLYFDQRGKLTQQFGITQVPARVYQEGKRLRIDEIVMVPATGEQQLSKAGRGQ